MCIRVNHSSLRHSRPRSRQVRYNSWRLYVRQNHSRLVQAPEKLSSVVKQQHSPAGNHYPGHLGQPQPRVGQMLEHIAAGDAVETLVGKRQPRQVGRHVLRHRTLQPRPRTAKHFRRQVAAGDAGARVGVLQQVFGDLSGAAADVEDLLGAAQVELAFAQQPIAERDVQRQQAGCGQQGALLAAVHVPHLVAILLIAHLPDQLVFDQPLDDLALGLRRCLAAALRAGAV